MSSLLGSSCLANARLAAIGVLQSATDGDGCVGERSRDRVGGEDGYTGVGMKREE